MKKKLKKEKIETLETVEKKKKGKKKINIDFKKLSKTFIDYMMSHKIFAVINILFLLITILAFLRKFLFGLVIIIELF